MSGGNSTCRIVIAILNSPKRRNRSNKQESTSLLDYCELFLSVANEMQMSDGKLYLPDRPNRTNRSNRKAFSRAPEYCEICLSVANEMQMSDRTL